MQIKSFKDTSLYTNLSKRDAQSATAFIDLVVRLIQDGTYPLALRITKDRHTSFIHLGKSIAKSDWDSSEKKVKKSHPNSGKLNTFLIDKIKEYNDLVLEWIFRG